MPEPRQRSGRARSLGAGGTVRAVAAAVLLAGAVVLWWAQASAGSDTSPGPIVLPMPAMTQETQTPSQPSASARASPGPTTHLETAPPPSGAATSADVMPAHRTLDPTLSWQQVLADLESHRSEAFRTGDGSLLAQVYAAGSAPLARDLELLSELDREAVHAQGLQLVIDDVAVVAVGPTQTTLRVTDRLPTYTVVDTAGVVVEQVPARGPVTWLLTMTPSPAGWRISEVVRA